MRNLQQIAVSGREQLVLSHPPIQPEALFVQPVVTRTGFANNRLDRSCARDEGLYASEREVQPERRGICLCLIGYKGPENDAILEQNTGFVREDLFHLKILYILAVFEERDPANDLALSDLDVDALQASRVGAANTSDLDVVIASVL